MDIVITRDGAQVASHVLPPGEYTIGSEAGCEIPIADGQISPQHARLTLNFDHSLIEDLGSQHGTFVNEKPVTEATRLWPNQRIRLGPSTTLALRRVKTGSTSELTAGLEQSPVHVLLPPEFLREKKYDIGGVVAEGGMGAILSAREATTEREVAMKVMLAGSNQSLLVRFIVEAKVTAQLEHPNIVPVHELGVDENDQVFYTMKFVSGITLRKVLEALADGDAETIRKYPLPHLLTIFQKICDAVAFAHSKGVLHRDLKPENIMVGDYGEVLLMDWGLAKVIGQAQAEPAPVNADSVLEPTYDSRASNTMAGMILGTPRYMSPEQARGEVETLDARTDIYALGAILYHMLALHTAVESSDAETVVEKVAAGQLIPLNTSRDGRRPHIPGGRIPDSLAAVVGKAMALDRGARYPTVEALQAEITAYQDGFATSAEAAGLFRQLALLVQRHKREFAIGFAAWLIITALAVWFVINLRASELRERQSAELARASEIKEKQSAEAARASEIKATQSALLAAADEKKESQAKEIAERALAKARIAAAEAAFRNGDAPAMIQELERCSKEYRDQSWEYLWAKRDPSLGTVKIAGYESPVSIAAVPGKPRQFAFVMRSGEIGFIDAVAQKVVKTIKADPPDIRRVDFSGDGRHLAVTRLNSHEVDFYDVKSGTKQKSFAAGGEVRHVTLSHDGQLIAILAATPNPTAELTVIETREARVRFKRIGHFSTVLIHPDGTRVLVTGTTQSRQFLIINAFDGRDLNRVQMLAGSQSLSPDGKVVAVGTPQGEVYLIDTTTGAELQRGRLYVGALGALAWTADGHLVSMGSEGRFRNGRWLMRLWGSDYLTPEATLFGFKTGIPWTLHAESGYVMAEESPPRLWRIPVGRELVKTEHLSEQGWSACFLSDTVLLGRNNYSLARYDLSTPGRATMLPGSLPERFVFGVSHWKSGLFAIAARGMDKRFNGFKLFLNQGSTAAEKLTKPTSDVIFDLAFDSAAERIAAVYRNGALELFSVKTGDSLLKIKGRFERVAFAGARQNLVALAALQHRKDSDQDYSLVLLDGASGKPMAKAEIQFRVGALAVSPDGKLVAAAGSDQSVHLYDAETLHERSSFRAHDGEIGAVAFHPSAPIVATASADGSVKLWDYNTARQVDYFVGLGGTPVTAAFSPDGRLLAVDGQERTSRVYDVSGVMADGATK